MLVGSKESQEGLSEKEGPLIPRRWEYTVYISGRQFDNLAPVLKTSLFFVTIIPGTYSNKNVINE
jgi:hypothetical protein